MLTAQGRDCTSDEELARHPGGCSRVERSWGASFALLCSRRLELSVTEARNGRSVEAGEETVVSSSAAVATVGTIIAWRGQWWGCGQWLFQPIRFPKPSRYLEEASARGASLGSRADEPAELLLVCFYEPSENVNVSCYKAQVLSQTTRIGGGHLRQACLAMPPLILRCCRS